MRNDFTPGPWTLRPFDDAQVCILGDSPPGLLCTVTGKRREANAKLIAHAPAMLEALEKTLRALESHLDSATRDAELSHRGLLCPCHDNEVKRARALLEELTDARS